MKTFLAIVLLMAQVFFKVANSSANTEDDLEEEECRQQMERLTDGQFGSFAVVSIFLTVRFIACCILVFSNRAKRASVI